MLHVLYSDRTLKNPSCQVMPKLIYSSSMTETETTHEVEDTASQDSRSLSSGSRPRHPMDLLLRNWSGVPAKTGDIVEGTVLEKKGARLFVDLGERGIGIVYGREYSVAKDIIKRLEPGELMSAKVVECDNAEGYTELSLKDVGEERTWMDFKKMMHEGEALELPVLEANRGGLMLEVRGIKGFLPASQLSSKNYPRVDGGDKEKIYQELQKLVGVVLKVKILDVDVPEQKLIFTEKGHHSETMQAALVKYNKGDEVEGEITGVVDFGAFMKFDEAGLEGLIHISEIDWILIDDPRKILKPGDRVRAKIIDIQGDKISLSLKQLKPDPWIRVAEKYHKGDLIAGIVIKFNPFGAFVQVDRDIHALLHISEFGTEVSMRAALEIGKEYEFRVLLVDPKDHRMSLGISGEKAVKETMVNPESIQTPDSSTKKEENTV